MSSRNEKRNHYIAKRMRLSEIYNFALRCFRLHFENMVKMDVLQNRLDIKKLLIPVLDLDKMTRIIAEA